MPNQLSHNLSVSPSTSNAATGKPSDWQISSIISDNQYEEVNCTSGEHRRITKAKCKCGERVLIEHDAHRFGVKTSNRADGKRVFYHGEEDTGWNVFRCKNCGEPISDTCPEAAYGLKSA